MLPVRHMRLANTASIRGAKKSDAIVLLPFAENRRKVMSSSRLIQNRCATPLYMSITASAKFHPSTAAHETTRGERRELQPSSDATQARERPLANEHGIYLKLVQDSPLIHHEK